MPIIGSAIKGAEAESNMRRAGVSRVAIDAGTEINRREMELSAVDMCPNAVQTGHFVDCPNVAPRWRVCGGGLFSISTAWCAGTTRANISITEQLYKTYSWTLLDHSVLITSVDVQVVLYNTLLERGVSIRKCAFDNLPKAYFVSAVVKAIEAVTNCFQTSNSASVRGA